MNKSLDETINKMLKEIEEKNFEYFDREKAIQQLVLQHNEITRLNNELQDFKVQDISNQEQLYNLIEENERLNNIINELEKILQKAIDEIYEYTEYNKGVNASCIYILEKLQELKEKKDE